ncbi:MAG TPA: methyltransferase domain-containing protein [Candidatus Limnocylindria bacterium]
MPEIRYDASVIRRYFDEFGIREWERLERRPMDRVNFEMHRRMLDRFVRSGDRVLEIGAGPGRFTIELARVGARVTVTDISPAQLDLNSEKVAAAGAEGAVVQRAVRDVLDLGAYAEGAFDATVCYGGALS